MTQQLSLLPFPQPTTQDDTRRQELSPVTQTKQHKARQPVIQSKKKKRKLFTRHGKPHAYGADMHVSARARMKTIIPLMRLSPSPLSGKFVQMKKQL